MHDDLVTYTKWDRLVLVARDNLPSSLIMNLNDGINEAGLGRIYDVDSDFVLRLSDAVTTAVTGCHL